MQRVQASAEAARSAGSAAEEARSNALAGSTMRVTPKKEAGPDEGSTGEGGAASPQAAAAASEALKGRPEEVRRKLRQRRVPSSRLGRVAGFAVISVSD